jgi:glycosyltransferase involved in cell wall biosynthesis
MCVLTIAIPTFNRADRLKVTLISILNEINTLQIQDKVGIFISNNNSSDNTTEILKQIKPIAIRHNVRFRYQNNLENLGASQNVLQCALNVDSKYMILMSDDDNITPGALLEVLDNIAQFKPSVAIYNFNQEPFGIENPLYKYKEFFELPKDFVMLNKLVKWYKLTGILLNVNDKSLIELMSKLKFEFAHVLLAILTSKAKGRLLLNPYFLAYPDIDYMDHVNFAPYVSELMHKDLTKLVKLGWISEFEATQLGNLLPRQSVVSRSIHRLYEYYAGNFPLTHKMKSQLWRNIMKRFLLQHKVSDEGLTLGVEMKDLIRLIRLFAYVIKFRCFVMLKLLKPRLEKEGF